jgi:glycosyltransferase involved in cell wall biosynthesis
MSVRRIRLCYSLNAFDLGGAETVALDLACHHDRTEFDVEVVAFIEPRRAACSEMRRRFDDAGVRTHTIVQSGFRSPLALARIHRYLSQGRFDIIHGHNRGSDYWGAKLAPLAGIRHAAWTRHSIYGDMSAKQAGRYRDLVDRGARVVAVSHAVERACVEGDGVPPSAIETIANGVDLMRYRPETADVRARVRTGLGLEPDQLMLLYVARFADLKAPEAFVELARDLNSRDNRIRGFMCGYGPLDERVRQLANAAGDAITVLGLRNDVPELLAACDLFVSTSRVEGLPLNVMEAMACGAAFVAPAIPQIIELVGSRPVLVRQLMAPLPPPGCSIAAVVGEWATHVTAVLSDAGMLKQAGECGRRAMVEDYSVQRMTQRYEDFFRRFLEAGQR